MSTTNDDAPPFGESESADPEGVSHDWFPLNRRSDRLVESSRDMRHSPQGIEPMAIDDCLIGMYYLG